MTCLITIDYRLPIGLFKRYSLVQLHSKWPSLLQRTMIISQIIAI